MTEHAPRSATVWISARSVTRIALILVSILVAAGLVVQWVKFGLGYPTALGLGPLFDPTREQNIPTWFSSALLFCSALALAFAASALRDRGHPDTHWWLVLAAVFCLASLDETATLHELVSRMGRRLPGSPDYFVRPWVLVLGPVALLFMYAYSGFLRRQESGVGPVFALGAALFVGGALGVELIEILLGPSRVGTLELALTMMLQEAMELVGAVVLLRASLVQFLFVSPARPLADPLGGE